MIGYVDFANNGYENCEAMMATRIVVIAETDLDDISTQQIMNQLQGFNGLRVSRVRATRLTDKQLVKAIA